MTEDRPPKRGTTSRGQTPLQPAASVEKLPKRPLGLVVFGVGLIVTSLSQMAALVEADRYWYLFQNLPPAAITGRYLVSWVARGIGLAAGIGIVQRREVFRKMAIALGWATIATVSWKHPYEGFARHLSDLELLVPEFRMRLSEALGQLGIERSTMTWMVVCTARAQEIALALLLIWYFTRSHVRAQFGPKPLRSST